MAPTSASPHVCCGLLPYYSPRCISIEFIGRSSCNDKPHTCRVAPYGRAHSPWMHARIYRWLCIIGVKQCCVFAGCNDSARPPPCQSIRTAPAPLLLLLSAQPPCSLSAPHSFLCPMSRSEQNEAMLTQHLKCNAFGRTGLRQPCPLWTHVRHAG
jgi:hypothetical protein